MSRLINGGNEMEIKNINFLEKEMRRKIIKLVNIFILGLLVTMPMQAQAAKGQIEVRNEVRKVETYTDKKGNKKQREVKAEKVVPNDELLYTIYFRNIGKQPASNIVINDPIPENMTYKIGSAFGSGTDILFSVDGGKTFAKEKKLKVKSKDGKSRPVTASDYTNIRWLFKPKLGPGEKGTVQFRAILR
jgi:uncharacterized repeat protein (TIGR01451 family)